MVNKLVYQNLVNLKNANQANKIFIDVSYNYLFLYFLRFFYSKGYILGFVFNKYKSVRIFLKYYKDKGLLIGLKFSLINPAFSYKSLLYIRYKYKLEQYLYMFSTSKGFLTLNDIFLSNINIGGILYFYLTVK